MLDIEIDGDSHDSKKYLDKQRDLYLVQRGITTIRFSNDEVLTDKFKIKDDLIKFIIKRKSSL